jgi:hypothetical protein
MGKSCSGKGSFFCDHESTSIDRYSIASATFEVYSASSEANVSRGVRLLTVYSFVVSRLLKIAIVCCAFKRQGK